MLYLWILIIIKCVNFIRYLYVHGASSAVNKNSSQSFDYNSLK